MRAIREDGTNPGEKASAPRVSQAAELASRFLSLQKISYLSLALFPKTKGIQLRDLHNGFLPSRRLCPIGVGKRDNVGSLTWTHTHVGRC